MYELRNRLTHQYLATVEKKAHIKKVSIKNNWNDSRAVIKGRSRFTLNVAKLIIDLGTAWDSLRQQLEVDSNKRGSIATLLNSLPILE